jgi:hypothetical protein
MRQFWRRVPTTTNPRAGPEGVLKVRNDLVHLSDLGASIAGYVIAAAIAPEWT